MDNKKFSHAELNQIACKWLLSMGCTIVLSELKTWGTFEIADVIGFKSGFSIVIESKTSRSDFLADKKKPWRKDPKKGMGNYRFFLCEEGIIKPEDLPPKWGLLHPWGIKVKKAVYPKVMGFWAGDTSFYQDCYMEGERGLLVSAAMRLGNQHTNISDKIYFKKCFQIDKEISHDQRI